MLFTSDGRTTPRWIVFSDRRFAVAKDDDNHSPKAQFFERAVNRSHSQRARRSGSTGLAFENGARYSVIFSVAESDESRSDPPFCGKSFRWP